MTSQSEVNKLLDKEYSAGFITDVESDALPPGLTEETIRQISLKKNEPAFMLEWRLKAFQHWLTLKEPHWAKIHYASIDYQKNHLLLCSKIYAKTQ